MLRLLSAILLFLISLLSIVNAPTYHLWILAILVTEFPIAFILLSAFLLIRNFWNKKYIIAVGVLTSLSIALLFIPIVKAYQIGREIDRKLNLEFPIKEFSNEGQHDNPVELLKLFGLNQQKKVAFETFTYKQGDKYSLSLDFYPSPVKGYRPVVIIIHGGSWSSGDSQQLPELNSELAHAGYHIASTNYRMAPRFKNPAAVEDAIAAINYLKNKSNELQIDSNSFVLLGRSAGAQIALLAAYSTKSKNLKGVIDFYGPADMVWGYSVPANPWVLNSRKVMEDYLGGTYQKIPYNYLASSPIEYVNQKTVPTLIIHGKKDVLVAYEHSVRLEKKLSDNNVPRFLLSLPWATHGFDFTLKGPGGQLSTHCILHFLKYLNQAEQNPPN